MGKELTVNQKPLSMNRAAPSVLCALLLLSLLDLGCALPPRPRPSASIVLDQVSEGVVIKRHGHSIAFWPGMPLEVGDEIETSADAWAVIRFYPAGHEVRLLPYTHVQLHSIFVYIGELFVKARGFFKVENEFVELDAEGTDFSFRVSRDQTVNVGVNEGRVRCRSKDGRWKTFRVQAGEEYVIPADKDPMPVRVAPSSPPQPEQGWCCLNGKVFEDDGTSCRKRRGRYFESEAEARRFCEPPDPSGWCCIGGKLDQDSAAGCRRREGQFFESEAVARRSCKPPDPYGWCCVSGRLSRDSASACLKRRGVFYESEAEARKQCKPIIW